jgi:hypothetical protein
MQPYKILSYFTIISIVLMSFSCEKEKDEPENEFPPTDRGEVEIDSYLFMVTDLSTQAVDTFKYGNFDTETATYDTLRWETISSSQKSYAAKIEFYNNGQEVNSKIITNEQDYIVCYREYFNDDLRLEDRNLDSDDRILGIESDWKAVNNSNSRGSGEMRITVNYQPLVKDGLCEPGVMIFEASVPYVITF